MYEACPRCNGSGVEWHRPKCKECLYFHGTLEPCRRQMEQTTREAFNSRKEVAFNGIRYAWEEKLITRNALVDVNFTLYWNGYGRRRRFYKGPWSMRVSR